MHTYRVADWMSTPPIVISPTTALSQAELLMQQRKIRRLPVVEHDRLIGIVTWGDLRAAQPSAASTLSVHEWRALLEHVPVRECMSSSPVTIEPDALVFDAAQLMLQHKIGGVPVVSHGHVVGMITESDLFRLMIANISGLTSGETLQNVLHCYHCGATLHGRSPESLDANDQCWQCHYHLHRCENCRYFDGIACMLRQPERHDSVPGQYCPAFTYISPRVATAADPEH